MTWRLGFDIGGTFTDFVLQDTEGGRLVVGKQLTTPREPAAAVFAGTDEVLARAGATLADVV